MMRHMEMRRVSDETHDDPAREDERLASIRHDLINCLTSLRLRLVLMEREAAIVDGHARAFQETLQRMDALIRDWRQIAVIAPEPERLSAFNLTHVVRTIFDAQAPNAHVKQQTYTLTIVDETIILIGNESAIARAVENTLNNAIKYTPAFGRISVTVLCHDRRGIVRVEDTGIGIPADAQRQIFRPYFRAENAIASGIPGSGLGLYQVRQAVEAHSGHVRIQNGTSGGTCVELHLPAFSKPQVGTRKALMVSVRPARPIRIGTSRRALGPLRHPSLCI